MAVWSRIVDGEIDHWADVPALAAWARNAADLASESRERDLMDASSDEQALTLVRSIDALASAFRAANLSAPTVPSYLAIVRDAYGPSFDAAAGTVTSDASEGWLARMARDVYVAATGGPAPSYKTYARLWISGSSQPRTFCIEPGDAPGACEQFAPSLSWTGRAHPGGGACLDPASDWQCVAWSLPPGATSALVSPAAVWSLGVVRLVAASILANPREWMLTALRNGASPLWPDGASAPPDDPTIDIASAVRPPPPATTTPPVVIVTPPGVRPPSTTTTTTPQPLTAREAFTFGPILLGALFVGAVILMQSPPKRRRT